MRVGELVCLKWEDIEGRYLHVHRMETRTHAIDYENLTSTETGLVVIDRVKSAAGDREIYLVDNAVKILEIVKEYNEKRQLEDNGFIFLNKRTRRRTTTEAVQSYLEYSCKKAGIDPKSSHKIRKTWVSGLGAAGMNIDTIRRMAGHEDERTTLNNYMFDTNSKKAIESALEKAAIPLPGLAAEA